MENEIWNFFILLHFNMSDLRSFLKPEFQEKRIKIEDVTSGGLIL